MKRMCAVLITLLFGFTLFSSNFSVAAAQKIQISQQPKDAIAAIGSYATVTVKANGDGLKYQWWVCNTGSSKFYRSSITTSSYKTIMSDTRDGRRIYCVVTDKYGSTCTTNTVMLRTHPKPVITQQPSSVSGDNGKIITTSVTAVGSDLHYQWWICSPNSNTFYRSSITTAEYKTLMDTARHGRRVYCVITDRYGDTVTSEIATLRIKKNVAITAQPTNVTVNDGDWATTSVSATGDGLTYQWWVCNNGNNTFQRSSITSASYKVCMDSSRDGRQLYCVITDAYGNQAVTETITLHLKHSVVILTQPSDRTVKNGETVTASIVATGDGLRYQWWFCNAGDDTFYKSSVTAADYTVVMNEARDGRLVYCVVTDKYGNQAMSRSALISINKAITIVTQPTDITASVGMDITVETTAEGEDLTYLWWARNADSDTFTPALITTPEYTTQMDPLYDGQQLYCEITNCYGTRVVTEIITIGLQKAELCAEHTFGDELLLCKAADGYKFVKTCSACGLSEAVYYPSILTFVDDDAKADALWHWERIMDATGIKVTSAVIASKVTKVTNYEGYYSYAGWDEIYRLRDKGMDFVNHTYNHVNLTKFTAEEIRADFTQAKTILEQHGIYSDILVYPNTAYNETVLSVVPEFFKAAVACGGVINTAPLKQVYTINRVNLNSSAVTKTITFGNQTVTCQGVRPLEELQEFADKAETQDGWLIFMCHAYDSPGGKTYFDEESEQTVIQFCKYVHTSGKGKFITLSEGLDLMQAYR